MSGTEVFSLTDVTYSRSRKKILERINWSVRSGENWVLLGANGIGKSTLINIISTRAFPTSGSVRVLGEKLGAVDVFKLRPRIGILGSDYALNFNNDENVLDLVAMGATAMTGSWGDDRDNAFLTQESRDLAYAKLADFGASSLVDKPWGVLSQGERKRVQMARTLMCEPELLLFDEPTAGLDLAGREIVINVLNKIAGNAQNNYANGKKPAIILVNHHVEEIPPSFDRCALMGTIDMTDDQCASENGSHTNTGTIIRQGLMSDVLTSANLTQAYCIDLTVTRLPNLRYNASASVIIER